MTLMWRPTKNGRQMLMRKKANYLPIFCSTKDNRYLDNANAKFAATAINSKNSRRSIPKIVSLLGNAMPMQRCHGHSVCVVPNKGELFYAQGFLAWSSCGLWRVNLSHINKWQGDSAPRMSHLPRLKSLLGRILHRSHLNVAAYRCARWPRHVCARAHTWMRRWAWVCADHNKTL